LFRVGVVAILVLLVVATILAARIGTRLGTPSEPTVPRKNCPGEQPDECRSLIAQLLHVDTAYLPTIDPAPASLTYVGGHVVLTGSGQASYVAFDYAATGSTVVYTIGMRVPTGPANKQWPNGRTPKGRTFQRVAPKASFLWYAFYDEHLVYSIQATGERSTSDPHVAAVAEELADTVHPTTRQIAP
jgi:hypothetical protein